MKKREYSRRKKLIEQKERNGEKSIAFERDRVNRKERKTEKQNEAKGRKRMKND